MLSLLTHWSLAPAKICNPIQEKVTVGEVLMPATVVGAAEAASGTGITPARSGRTRIRRVRAAAAPTARWDRGRRTGPVAADRCGRCGRRSNGQVDGTPGLPKTTVLPWYTAWNSGIGFGDRVVQERRTESGVGGEQHDLLRHFLRRQQVWPHSGRLPHERLVDAVSAGR